MRQDRSCTPWRIVQSLIITGHAAVFISSFKHTTLPQLNQRLNTSVPQATLVTRSTLTCILQGGQSRDSHPVTALNSLQNSQVAAVYYLLDCRFLFLPTRQKCHFLKEKYFLQQNTVSRGGGVRPVPDNKTCGNRVSVRLFYMFYRLSSSPAWLTTVVLVLVGRGGVVSWRI